MLVPSPLPAQRSAEAERLLARGRVDRDSGFASGNRTLLDRGLLEFWRATHAAPRSPAAWYELGTTKLEMWKRHIMPKEAPHQQIGERYLDAAAGDFLAAAERESDGLGAVALAGLILDPNLRKYPLDRLARRLLPAMRRQAQDRQALAFYLAWGRIEGELGDSAEAARAFDDACTAAGAASLSCFELARTMLRLGEAGGDTLYYAAAASTDPATTAAFRADLALLADSAQLSAFDRTAGDARIQWVRAFWAERDAAEFRPTGERLREHYRRLAHVRSHFRLVQWPRRYEWWEVYRPDSGEFDDRGVSYLRHGKPDLTVTFLDPAVQACYNESWLYRRPNGNMFFHFAARSDPSDWRMVESVMEVQGTESTVSARSFQQCPPVDVKELVRSRAPIDPIYSHVNLGPWQEDERRMVRRNVARGVSTDSYAWRFGRTLTPIVLPYAVMRTGSPGGTILVVFSVPGEQLMGDEAADGTWRYRLRIRTQAVDRAGGRSVEQDTVRTFTTRSRLGRGRFLSALTELAVPPADYRVGVVVAEPDADRGQAVSFERLAVVAPAPGEIRMSDLVLGSAASGLSWQGSGAPVALNPLNAFAPGAAVELYYQLTGLAAGERYRTSIALAPKDTTDRGRTLRLSFEDAAPGAFAEWRRTLSLAGVASGTYLLTVEIRRADRVAARREQTVNVIGK
jgi:GWxTD domain-containing protein